MVETDGSANLSLNGASLQVRGGLWRGICSFILLMRGSDNWKIKLFYTVVDYSDFWLNEISTLK
jgi:hypothetical protein